MAAGDVKAALTSIPGMTNLDIQPASGEHWFIQSLVGTWAAVSLSRVDVYDGTSTLPLLNITTGFPIGGIGDWLGGYQPATTGRFPSHGMYINNTAYLRVRNAGGGALDFSYHGLQIK